jgi:hypothetical protein
MGPKSPQFLIFLDIWNRDIESYKTECSQGVLFLFHSAFFDSFSITLLYSMRKTFKQQSPKNELKLK